MKSIITAEFLKILEEFNIFQALTGENHIPVLQYVNRFKLGELVSYAENTMIEEFSTFAFGNTLFSSGAFSSLASTLPQETIVGRYTSMAPNVRAMGFRHPIESVSTSSAVFNFSRENVHTYFSRYENAQRIKLDKKKVPTPQKGGRIIIGNDVWIGSDVKIAGGVHIADGAVIASGSIVTRNVLPYSIVGGNPAKHIKWRFDEQIIEQLLKIQWWDYELGDLFKAKFDFSNPRLFIDQVIENKGLSKASYKKFSPYLFFKYGVSEPFSFNFIFTNHNQLIVYDDEKKLIKQIEFRSIQNNNNYYPLMYDPNENTIKSTKDDFYIQSIAHDEVIFSADPQKTDLKVINNAGSISIKNINTDKFLSFNKNGDLSYELHCLESEVFLTGFCINRSLKVH